jgi:Fe-S cluster assembly scaffold protein SufB
MKYENPKISIRETPILDRWDEPSREIRVRKGECLKYVLFPDRDGAYERRFVLEEGAIFRWAGIAIWANMVLKMTVSLEWSESEAHLHLLWLAKNNTTLELSWIGRVSLWCRNIKLRIDQNNILLGTGARIRGMPVLEVATDSIEWGHSCRIHRVSDEAMFYLESHGLSRESAESLLLEAEVRRCTDLLEEQGERVKEEVIERIKIKK